MTFKFKCSNCGEYKVTEDTFRAFVARGLQEKLTKAGTVKEAIFEFRKDAGCPKCKTKGGSSGKLRIR